MTKGKFDSDRDSALHYLCTQEWSNESFGDVESPTGYVFRISNEWDEVKPKNTEFTSVLDEWLELQGSDVEDSPEFRRSLVGHFLVQEDSNGFVHIREYATPTALRHDFDILQNDFSEWAGQGDD